MKKHGLRGLARMTLMTLVLAGTAFATTVEKLNLAQLVERSSVILEGRVEAVYSRWEPSHRVIYTYTSVRVDEAFKADRARRTVLVKTLGGNVNGISYSVSGMPQFRTGDHVILFLREGRDTTFEVVGLHQGRFQVIEGPGDTRFAVAHVSGIDLFDPKTGEITRPAFIDQMPREEFVARIKSLIRRER